MKDFLLNYFDEEIVDTTLKAKKYKRIFGVINSPVSKESEVDIDLAIKLYNKYKLPIYKIAMLYGVSDATMRTYFIKHNVNLKGHRVGKNSDNKYFSNINSCDKAYYLGLIFADGCIQSREHKGQKMFSIGLMEDDKYILETLNKYGNFNTDVTLSHTNDTNRKPLAVLRVHSSQVYDDLVKLGVEEHKSHKLMNIPKIRKQLIPHFIRGFFDGDGIAKSNGYIGLCGDYNMISFIKQHLIEECGVKDNMITFNKSNNIHYIQWGSKKDRQAIFDYLYKNKKDLYLKRKYEKIKQNL